MKKRTRDLLGHIWEMSKSVFIIIFCLSLFVIGAREIWATYYDEDCQRVCTSQGMCVHLYTAQARVGPAFGPIYCTCTKVRKLTLEGEHYE